MCMADDADRVELLSTALVKARKEHACLECRRVIKPGELYLRESYVSDGFRTHRTCTHCLIAREWLLKECNGFLYGFVLEDVAEHFHEYRSLYPWKFRIGLGRLVVGMQSKWANGKMPRLPLTTAQYRNVTA